MTTTGTLPEKFSALEPWVEDWALATRPERYEKRLSKTIDELQEFYDAIAPVAEEAIEYLDGFDVNDLPEAETRLMHLLYSMIMVSYPVNIFKQPRIPDSGAAFFNTAVEPAI
ncbi:hypothetical protein I6A84_30790 [Frankia sp. CNm7]|uniref:Xaa-Pro dipeptidase n=1 Tax=Frankia nepalensis TaxID=1836974 RepID=A0A937RE48_9ACTN|nr:hypothetical protein [Frankia nepalensis]MBL7502769.1 hypothetical protein [Frankia nepalensis]MBL7510666.1 hypothetical protein [Frankia nepalensis]MBL7522351.1 hypothetical protein [Frankia nepalensis]MBL7627199.1 hypothetical protein [Frankia nepalensis]